MLSESMKAEVQPRPSEMAPRGELGFSLVLREFQHRMANTLTVLNAGLRLQFATFTDPKLREAMRRHQEQVLAVAELHRFFAGGAGTGEISAEGHFQALCAILSRSVLAP